MAPLSATPSLRHRRRAPSHPLYFDRRHAFTGRRTSFRHLTAAAVLLLGTLLVADVPTRIGASADSEACGTGVVKILSSTAAHPSEGVIQSPNYPNEYPGSTACHWRAVIPPGYMFTLKFVGACFDLETTPRGCLDYIQIRSETVNLTQCGTKKPPDVHFNFEDEDHHEVDVYFRSSRAAHACGFSAKYVLFDWRNSMWDVTRCSPPESRIKCENGGFCVTNTGQKDGSKADQNRSNEKCWCPSGFHGDRCECTDACWTDPSTSTGTNRSAVAEGPCPTGTRCVRKGCGQFECRCDDGYHYFGGRCNDVDECAIGGACSFGQTCVNTPGSFRCECAGTPTEPDEVCYQHCDQDWLAHGNKCFFFSDQEVGLAGAEQSCRAMNATLATISTPSESYFLGLNSRKASAWIGLSDAASEQHWVWVTKRDDDEEKGDDDKRDVAKTDAGRQRPGGSKGPSASVSVTFSSWAMNQPSGVGDGAVLYPYHWARAQCTERKRFLCSGPGDLGCPGGWRMFEDTCYYKSNYEADFRSARRFCRHMHPLADLATFPSFNGTVAVPPEFWTNGDSAEGRSHYWIGYAMRTRASSRRASSPSQPTSRRQQFPDGDYKDDRTYSDWSWVTTATAASDEDDGKMYNKFENWHVAFEPPSAAPAGRNGGDGLGPSLGDDISAVDGDGGTDLCAFMFPSVWGDAPGDEPSAGDSWPGFICQKAVV